MKPNSNAENGGGDDSALGVQLKLLADAGVGHIKIDGTVSHRIVCCTRTDDTLLAVYTAHECSPNPAPQTCNTAPLAPFWCALQRHPALQTVCGPWPLMPNTNTCWVVKKSKLQPATPTECNAFFQSKLLLGLISFITGACARRALVLVLVLTRHRLARQRHRAFKAVHRWQGSNRAQAVPRDAVQWEHQVRAWGYITALYRQPCGSSGQDGRTAHRRYRVPGQPAACCVISSRGSHTCQPASLPVMASTPRFVC